MPLDRPRIFRIAGVFVALLLAMPLRAQTPLKLKAGSPEAEFAERLNREIKSMTMGADSENVAFNARISAMNAASPLDPKHLDSTDVAANVALVLDFTHYLKRERQWSDSLAQSFKDSMFVLSNERPADLKVLDAADVEISFGIERDAFNTFLDAMNKVYSDVLDVLLFMHHSHYTIAKNRPVFDTHEDVKEYIKLVNAVDTDSKALNKANQELRSANSKANALTQKQESSWTP